MEGWGRKTPTYNPATQIFYSCAHYGGKTLSDLAHKGDYGGYICMYVYGKKHAVTLPQSPNAHLYPLRGVRYSSGGARGEKKTTMYMIFIEAVPKCALLPETRAKNGHKTF